jgi:hypothetical protein
LPVFPENGGQFVDSLTILAGECRHSVSFVGVEGLDS